MNHRWRPLTDTGTGLAYNVPVNSMDLSSYYNSVEWDLMEVFANKTDSYYPCCPEPYPDVTFHFRVSNYVKRKPRKILKIISVFSVNGA